MMDFCRLSFDGLGTSCARCGSWIRGTEAPTCPPYITRAEPDWQRLPNIKTHDDNARAYVDFMHAREVECAAQRKSPTAPAGGG